MAGSLIKETVAKRGKYAASTDVKLAIVESRHIVGGFDPTARSSFREWKVNESSKFLCKVSSTSFWDE